MVYDGAGSPNVLQYWLTTSDVGVHSKIVKAGRKYRFQVRAITNCDTEDLSCSCFGEFSEAQVFTVRGPCALLPPLMPQCNSGTRVISSNKATIFVLWNPPVGNGGSPITGYILFMNDHNGTVTNYVFDQETTRWQIEALHPGEVYCFHVVATNAFGKSGNSPVLSTLAATHPGWSCAGPPEYSKLKNCPIITYIQESLLALKWLPLPADISGGSSITGFKLYLYKYAYPLLHLDADHIKEEVQHIVISG